MQTSIVGVGIDTVKINSKLLDPDGNPCSSQAVPPRLETLFENWQEQAREQGTPLATSLSFHQARLSIFPNGAPAWKYLLRNDCLEVKIGPRLKVPMVAKVTLLSVYLWKAKEGTISEAVAEVARFLMEVFERPLGLQAGQIDLCVDMAGFRLPKEWEKVFISQAKRKNPIGESLKDRARYTGRKLETLNFSGHGRPVSCKIYNKEVEIKQHSPDKVWFHDLWKAKGWDGNTPVWRIEFSLEREGLHQMGLEDIDAVLRNLKRM